jgi:hypothetical protein
VIFESGADPLAVWGYAERYLGVGTRSYSTFAADLEISEEYHPQRGRDTFTVETFVVPDGLGTYLGNGMGSGLHELYRRDGAFLLPVHPDTLTLDGLLGFDRLRGCARGPRLTVAPTANARTVLVTAADGAPVPPHFVKLHYPRRLSRFTRRLRRPIIELQLWVSAELARVEVPFLREVGGGVFGDDPHEAWGFLLREARPAGPAPAYLVPLFALYGGDYRRPGDPTLFEQLVERSGAPAEEFLVERVVRPMVALWLTVAGESGCAPEMHAQNTLFGFAAQGTETGIVYRDCGIYVDPAVRRDRSLPPALPPVNVISRDVPFPREQVFSLVYDSFMGHHALAYLAELAGQRFGVPPHALHAAARAEFAGRSAGRPPLPDTVFYYDEALHPDGQFRLVDTGERPLWR